MAYPEWARVGKRIGVVSRVSNWWVGDWVRYGVERWGERYVQAAKLTGYDVHSLRNMAYVASRVDSSLRRDDLTWSHHALLAALEPEAQRYWLERAVKDRLSVADLRLELRSVRRVEQDQRQVSVVEHEPQAVCPNCGFPIDVHVQ
jgi:hypothetical protein